MPSFDIVSEIDKVELRNAIEQASKEVATRYDFKGSSAHVELSDTKIIVYADVEFQLDQVKDILISKLSKRGVDVRCLEYEKIEKISGNKIKQSVTARQGIESELAKKIVKIVKDNPKLKVQVSIQGDTVRISGPKRDNLQETIALLRSTITDFPLQFSNFRE